jgi:hypothetical protein
MKATAALAIHRGAGTQTCRIDTRVDAPPLIVASVTFSGAVRITFQ